ncbi:uncharacterized protein LOC111258755 [Varroa jacobsoni]|uniref:Uncharacterized protein n=1 Tax=Varroa destructor TaxID=109461 RepID=A0A7M7K293_VARDE|nr:uncharacterized protein LOC111250141 [Varroa destructor]XP_022660649.1 uncharacterized protein LOC111250141 [Varroa destructor]XP_022660650.1 uncharacterized protein LOC111250141 [Varroa destructor]XP_022685989.1 uncharacterized protein LOC111258755 [Varroa jacobsoni]XP_022685990.1 uncharacterized protein LOC111258755 [Varroa jacobsoni]XP_022685991.1 uncharacterized protein LOC111258755 [Varroa jacobsoni]
MKSAKSKSRLQWFELPPPRKVRGWAHLSNKSKQRLISLLHSRVPVDQIPTVLQDEIKEDPERIRRYLWSVQSRLKNQRKSRRDPRYAPADIVALMRWSMVISKEQRRKNISHPPNSAPLVRAFINKADQISNGNSNIWTDENEKGSTTGMPSSGGPSTSHAGNTRQNAMNFTLANMYRYMVQATEDYEPPRTELMAALLRFFTERLLMRLDVAKNRPDGDCIDELIRLLANKGETIANLQIRASDRVYWSGQGRPPPGWDPKAYTDAIYNPPSDTANLDNPSTASGQGAEAVDGTSFSGENSIAPIGGLLSRAAAVSNLLQIPLTLLKKVAEVLTASVPPPKAYVGRTQEKNAPQQQQESNIHVETEPTAQATLQGCSDSARIDQVMELVAEYQHGKDEPEELRTQDAKLQQYLNHSESEDDTGEVVLVRIE